MTDPIETFALTTQAVAAIIDSEPDPRSETPCPEWNYAQLLGHLVGGDRLFARILTAEGGPPRTPRMAPDPDRPAPTVRDYREASSRLVELLCDKAIRDAIHQVPVGPIPGHQVVVLRSVEHVLHGWDLAKSAGASTSGLEPAASALRQPALQLLSAIGERTLADRRPFGASVTVDGACSDLDRLVAAFGRDPQWRPDPDQGYARLKQRFASYDDVELPDGTRRGYGAEGMRVAGSVFACPHQGRLMIKLPSDQVNRLIDTGVGLALAKPGQRPMREWVLVPLDGAAARRAERSYLFVRGS
jgi:uncharacterized protein (TIGR03086 family)